MTNTFRSLCTELFNELQGYKVAHPHHDRSLLIRARTTLAQPAPPAEGEAVELLQAAHTSFKLTQDPADYPADHWSRRATELLDRTHRAALAQPEPAGEVTDEELDKVMFQAVWARMDDASDLTSDEIDLLKARAAIALDRSRRQTEQAGELPPGYIDSGHSDLNRELLDAFYLAAQNEGGTADEIHLRGIQAAIALDRSRRAPVQAAAAPEHELLTQFNDATSSIERELRQARAVMEEVLIARRAPVQPAAGEVGELVEWLKGSAEDERWLCGGNNHRSEKLDRAAALLQRLQPVQPVAVSERLPRAEDCLDEGWAWFFSPQVGWRQAVLPVSPAFTHWLPAHVLPLPFTLPEAP